MKYIIVGSNDIVKSKCYMSNFSLDYPWPFLSLTRKPIILSLAEARVHMKIIKSHINEYYMERKYNIIPYYMYKNYE